MLATRSSSSSHPHVCIFFLSWSHCPAMGELRFHQSSATTASTTATPLLRPGPRLNHRQGGKAPNHPPAIPTALLASCPKPFFSKPARVEEVERRSSLEPYLVDPRGGSHTSPVLAIRTRCYRHQREREGGAASYT